MTNTTTLATARAIYPRARPANDDQQSIGQVLRALQRRPARTSYFVATVFSAAWLSAASLWRGPIMPDLTRRFGSGPLSPRR